jgi:hypothetical protein
MYLELGFLNPKTKRAITGPLSETHDKLARTKLKMRDASDAVAEGYVRYGILRGEVYSQVRNEHVKFCSFQYNGNEVGKRLIVNFVDNHPEVGMVGIDVDHGYGYSFKEYEREDFLAIFK